MNLPSKFYKVFFSFIFFFVLFTIKAENVLAATYYVAPTGNDSYTTTQAQNPDTPWQTLSGAQTKAANGDTIYVAAGTYKHATSYTNFTKTITWNAVGTVTVQSAASEAVRVANFANNSATDFIVINGFTFDGESAKSNGVLISSGSGNVTFSNVVFQNATTTMLSHNNAHGISIINSTFTMLPTSTAVLISSTSSDVVIQGTVFNFPSGSSGIVSRSATTGALTFTNNTLNGSGSGNMLYITGGGNVVFNNNNITLTGSIGTIVLTSGGSGSFEIKNNTVNYTKSTNETFFFNTGTWALDIENNAITSTDPSMTMAVFSINNQANALVQNNTIDSLATADRGQIFVRSTGTDMGTLRIIGNTLKSRSDLFIINIGTDLPNAGSGKINGAIIENNTLYGPVYFNPSLTSSGCHGIFYSQNQNGILRNNTIYGAGYGFVIKGTGDTWSSGGVSYNKVINSSSSGTAIRIKGAIAVPVYNNTIYSDSTLTNPLIYVTNYDFGSGSGGAIVKNNILACVNCMGISVDADSEPNFISDYNLFYRSTGTNIGTVNTTTYTNFSDWQTAGYDLHGINADPMFMDFDSDDFRLQRVSSAINAGVDLGLTNDIVNTSIPQGGGPDMGAYEYIPLTVTINQKDNQADPTNSTTINFSVVFSEPVADFTSEDVTLSGTAEATTALVTGSGATYNIAISGMTGSGTVIASIGADKATGSSGNTNEVSTSTDNIVTYDITEPTVSSISSGTPTPNEATITWTTNKDSSSKVDYGLTNSYGSSTSEIDTSPRVQNHSVALSGLTSCTTYHYRVRSKDLFSNEATSSDNTFTTSGCTSTDSSNSSSNTTSSPAFYCDNTSPKSAPTLYSAVPQGTDSVLLSFTGADDPVEHYALEFGRESGKYIWGATTIGDNNTRSYLVKSLSPNTTYYFRVRAGNGCATGNWSQEISAKTKGYVAFNQLEFTDSSLNSTKPPEQKENSCQIYTVKSGDNLWKVAQSQLGDGNRFKEIIEQNKEKYPSLASSNNLNAGWELSIDCDQNEDIKTTGTKEATQENAPKSSYTVKVKVKDKDNKPVANAKVTMHSKVQTAYTNQEGVAEFKDVEPGDHKVLIAYQGYEGQQSLNLTGDVKEFDLNITVEPKKVMFSSISLGIISVLSIALIVITVVFIKTRKM